jgi:transcriptional regulator with XRE-family HTH domain
MPITGLDLRAERRAADITVVDIAARMGLSRQAVHALERSAVLTIERVERYRAALRDAIVASGERVA